ncbi:Transcriptional regulator of ribosomal biogenesis protein [Gamsiella multidivaricata]|nr:Transcriptional regulator of ribosomal biogenesis protein [Gamsiella multidivaricata]
MKSNLVVDGDRDYDCDYEDEEDEEEEEEEGEEDGDEWDEGKVFLGMHNDNGEEEEDGGWSDSSDSGGFSAYQHQYHHGTENPGASAGLKRKTVVSLADLYVEDENGNDNSSDTSAFPNAVLRTTESLGQPLRKRQALESSRSEALPTTTWSRPLLLPSSSSPGNGAGMFPPQGVVLGGNGKPIGPLLTESYPHQHPRQHPLAIFSGPQPSPLTSAATATNGSNTTMDWIRQQDEVYTLLENMTRNPSNTFDENKPYRCSVPGCDKAYKNPNGLKYHNQHGHSSSSAGSGLMEGESPEVRPYVCTFLDCGKRYKNLNGLKYHIEHTHPNLIAALRAHQVGVTTGQLLVGQQHTTWGGVGVDCKAAAMTIVAALEAVEKNPMMALAANAILTAYTAAANASASTAASATNAVVPAVTEVSANASKGQETSVGA